MRETTAVDGTEDAVIRVPRRATKSAGMSLLLAAAGMFGMSLGGYVPAVPREVTDEDRARLARAEAKRDRKRAARKAGA